MSTVPETGKENEVRKKIPLRGERPIDEDIDKSPKQDQKRSDQDQQQDQQPKEHLTTPQPKKPVKRINTNLQWQLTGLPRVYDSTNIFEVISNEDFIVNDLAMAGRSGAVRWTTIYITLMGHKQSLSFSVRKGVLKYHVREGEAWISINSKGQIVKAGDDIIVEEGEMHKFFNNSRTVECKLVLEYAGHLDLRKFIEVENAVIEG